MKDLKSIVIVLFLAIFYFYRLGLEPEEKDTGRPAVAQAMQIISNDTDQWSYDLAIATGNTDPSNDIINFISAWQQAENTSATYNPLATSQDMPGATIFNSHGVKEYTSRDQGLEATVKTLQADYPGYNYILYGIQTNDSDLALKGLEMSPWGTEINNVKSLLRNTSHVISGKKCPFTDTMAYDSSFYSTGSDAWSGQYNGYHLGVDFTGEGNVYAPFDMTIDQNGGIGFYEDPNRYGKFIQAHFTDRYLFYSGHLKETFVTEGQFVPACTIIGISGATDYKHVHIKIASPNASVPCEGSVPGEYGCVDPLEYWNSR